MGSGRDSSGNPTTVFTIERAGQDAWRSPSTPGSPGEDRWRRVGIMPGYDLNRGHRSEGLGDGEGRPPAWRPHRLGQRAAEVMNLSGLADELDLAPAKPAQLGVVRAGLDDRRSSCRRGSRAFRSGTSSSRPATT
jgi:hypothetical protein